MDLSWEQAGTSSAAGGEDQPASTREPTPPAQDMAEEEVPTQEVDAARGLCLLWREVVESLIESYPVALEPAKNLLTEIETVIAEGLVPDPDASLPEEEDAARAAPVRTEQARVALQLSPERPLVGSLEQQPVVRDQEVEAAGPSEASAAQAGSNSVAEEIRALLEDELITPATASARMNSLHGIMGYIEVRCRTACVTSSRVVLVVITI